MTRMTPSEAFVETLAAHNVKYVFGIVGSAFMDALDIFEPAGIKFIPVIGPIIIRIRIQQVVGIRCCVPVIICIPVPCILT